MSKKLKELKEKRAGLYTQIDSLRKETDGREMTAEEQQRWNSLISDFDKTDKEIATEERFLDIQKRQLEEASRRESEEGADARANAEYRSAFADYLINGAQGVSPENRAIIEKRAAITGLSAGVLVPTELSNAIEVAIKSYGGMFEAGQIITTSRGSDLILPTVNDTDTKATIVAEYNQSTKKAPTFGSVTLKAYTYRTPIIPVSLELLQDSAFDLDPLLSGLLADAFGRGINEHLTMGDGTGKPKGVVTSAVECTNKAAATSINLDNIIDLIKSVDTAYARNGKFMFNKNTLWELAKIKDTTGQFIWQQNAREGLAPTLFGKGYIINDDVADIGKGNASVLFGDFSKYKIRVVKGFKVIRLNELLAEYLSIGLFGFARADGVLLDAGTNPVKKLVHAAS